MWMSSIIIVIDSKNVDRNNIQDLVAAVVDAGGTVSEVDEPNYVIEATVPSYVIPTIAAMEGVVYVRSIFSYFRDSAGTESDQAGDANKSRGQSPESKSSTGDGTAKNIAPSRPAARVAVG
jgi:hypothetical protein